MALSLLVEHEPFVDAAKVTLGGVLAGPHVVWRVAPSGTVSYVRGFAPPGATLAAASVIVRDYELPLGVPLDYYAARLDGAGAVVEQAGPVEFELPSEPSDDPWLVDLVRPSSSLRTTVESLPELRHETPAGVHRVLGRRTPIVTSDVAWSWSAELRFVTATAQLEQAALALLGSGVPFLLRTPPEQGVGSVFLFPVGFNVERASRLALHDDRRFVVGVVQVDRPDPALFVPVPPATYEAVDAAFDDYADLEASRPSYDAVLYDYSLAEAPFSPWPPVDA